MNILRIAKAHQRQKMDLPAATYTVSEWVDPDTQQPVELLIMRLSSAEISQIVAARKEAGDIGAMIMTIIKCCHESTPERRRAFANTDFNELMANVDRDALKKIHDAILAALPDLGVI